MTTKDVTLYWAPPSTATSGSTYRILSDKDQSGTFVAVTADRPATSPYAGVVTTLASALTTTDTTVELTDGTNFSEGDLISVGYEVIELGTKSTNTFTGCTRGANNTQTAEHSQSDDVKKLTEEYTDNNVDFTSRYVIRYKIVHYDTQGHESVAALALAIAPPLPPDTKYSTVYGILQSEGSPVSGVAVTLSQSDVDNFLSSGETVYKTTHSTTTDNDGFFYFYIPRDRYLLPAGGDPFIIKVAAGTTSEWSKSISVIPDQDFVNFVNVS